MEDSSTSGKAEFERMKRDAGNKGRSLIEADRHQESKSSALRARPDVVAGQQEEERPRPEGNRESGAHEEENLRARATHLIGKARTRTEKTEETYYGARRRGGSQGRKKKILI